MNRRDLLKAAGLTTLASVAAAKGFAIPQGGDNALADCVLYPEETAGPFPLDLSKDSSKFRQAIQEDRQGVPIKVILSIANVNLNCEPMANVRVDLWHNDKEGNYSGFASMNSEGETWCRGIQYADGDGQVTFTSIYPGWYPGRTTHMHFSVYLGTTHVITSQLAFPDAINNEVYDNNPTLYTKGRNTSVANNLADSIFAQPSGALARQLATVVTDSTTGGYIAGLLVPVAGPIAGIKHPETDSEFKLEQNYPNPFTRETEIGFTLVNGGYVSLDIFNVQGVKVASIGTAPFAAGRHSIKLDRIGLLRDLPVGNYVYQFTCANPRGSFSQCKVMTVQR